MIVCNHSFDDWTCSIMILDWVVKMRYFVPLIVFLDVNHSKQRCMAPLASYSDFTLCVLAFIHTNLRLLGEKWRLFGPKWMMMRLIPCFVVKKESVDQQDQVVSTMWRSQEAVVKMLFWRKRRSSLKREWLRREAVMLFVDLSLFVRSCDENVVTGC